MRRLVSILVIFSAAGCSPTKHLSEENNFDERANACEVVPDDGAELEAFVPSEHLASFDDCARVGDLFTVRKALGNTYHLSFKTQREMNAAFVRIEPHYEAASDDFRGQVFDLDTYKQWYVDTYGAWDVDVAYEGFNFPSHVLEPFASGAFPDQTEDEERIWKFFFGLESEFYFIVTNRETVSATMSHEIAHALFFADADYNREVTAALEGLSIERQEELRALIVAEDGYGYHPSVATDEMQAFLGSNWFELFCDEAESSLPGQLDAYADAILRLQEVYATHYHGPDTDSARQAPLSERGCDID